MLYISAYVHRDHAYVPCHFIVRYAGEIGAQGLDIQHSLLRKEVFKELNEMSSDSLAHQLMDESIPWQSEPIHYQVVQLRRSKKHAHSTKYTSVYFMVAETVARAFAFSISHSHLRFRIRVYDFAFVFTISHSRLRFRIRVYDFAFAFTILHSHLRFCFRVYDFAIAFTMLHSSCLIVLLHSCCT